MTSVDRWMLPEGVDELLPERAAVAEQLRRNILDLLKSWGYQLVVPPLIEFTDSLLIGMGKDIETQSFKLTDQISGKSMAVRADITPQTARIDAHSLKAKGIRRLCYAGSVLHTRPKTLMASRCPMQIGAEIYGDASISADIEVISLLLETLHVIDNEFTSAHGAASKGLCKLTLDLGHVSI
ncbi:MAG: ATP phosphoribosyltransferase regulatory subunit, partial [Pseudomonadales bacterium]